MPFATSSAVNRFAIIFVVFLLSASVGTSAQRGERRFQVPAGTALLLTLRTPLNSEKATVLDQVEATLWSPVVQDGVELIPEGSIAFGSIVDVKRATEREPLGSIAIAFSVVEHAETKSRATVTTRRLVVEAKPLPVKGRRGRQKPVNATMAEGTPIVAITAEPLLVRIPQKASK